jgi:hypothetical protein
MGVDRSRREALEDFAEHQSKLALEAVGAELPWLLLAAFPPIQNARSPERKTRLR